MTPDDIPAVNRRLKAAYRAGHAPIMDLEAAQTGDPFRILVGTILSARTKDACTAGACQRLFARADTPEALAKLPEETIAKLIYPVGFYRTKARNLSALPRALNEKFDGGIPQAIEELCRLPGVGRKTANLVLALAFKKPAICVDVHVHRIVNRLGLLKTRTPLETEMGLRDILPRRYWRTWNSYLVAFGQTRCLPRNPRCEGCPLRSWCDHGASGTSPAEKTNRTAHR